MKRKELFAKFGGVILAASMSCTMLPSATYADTEVPIVKDDDGTIIVENDLDNSQILNASVDEESQNDESEAEDDEDTDKSTSGSISIVSSETDLSYTNRDFSVTLKPTDVEKDTALKLIAFEADADMTLASVSVSSTDEESDNQTATIYEYDKSKLLICKQEIECGQSYTVPDSTTKYIAISAENSITDDIVVTVSGEVNADTEKENLSIRGFLVDSQVLSNGKAYGEEKLSFTYDKTAMDAPSVTMDKTSLSYLENGKITINNLNANPNITQQSEMTLNFGDGLFIDTIKLPTFKDNNAPKIKIYADDAILITPVYSGNVIYVNRTVSSLKFVFIKDSFDFTQSGNMEIAVRNITSKSQTNNVEWQYSLADGTLYESGAFSVELVQNTNPTPDVDPSPVDPDNPDQPDVPDNPDTPDVPTPTPTPEITPNLTEAPEKTDTSKDTSVDVTTSNTKPKNDTTVKKESVAVSGDEVIQASVATLSNGNKVVLDYAGTESIAASTESSSLFDTSGTIESSDYSYVPTQKIEKDEVEDVDDDGLTYQIEAESESNEVSAIDEKNGEGDKGIEGVSVFDNIIRALLIVAGVVAGAIIVLASVLHVRRKPKNKPDETEETEDNSDDKED